MLPRESISAESDGSNVSSFDFQRLFEEAPISLLVVEAESLRVKHANAAARAMFGYEHGEFASLLVHQLTHPADEARSTQLRRALSDGYVDELHFEKRYIRKDGRVFWAEVNAVRERRDPGCSSRFILSLIDVSTRKQWLHSGT